MTCSLPGIVDTAHFTSRQTGLNEVFVCLWVLILSRPKTLFIYLFFSNNSDSSKHLQTLFEHVCVHVRKAFDVGKSHFAQNIFQSH